MPLSAFGQTQRTGCGAGAFKERAFARPRKKEEVDEPYRRHGGGNSQLNQQLTGVVKTSSDTPLCHRKSKSIALA